MNIFGDHACSFVCKTAKGKRVRDMEGEGVARKARSLLLCYSSLGARTLERSGTRNSPTTEAAPKVTALGERPDYFYNFYFLIL